MLIFSLHSIYILLPPLSRFYFSQQRENNLKQTQISKISTLNNFRISQGPGLSLRENNSRKTFVITILLKGF